MNKRGQKDTGIVSWETWDIGTRHLRVTNLMERGIAITKGGNSHPNFLNRKIHVSIYFFLLQVNSEKNASYWAGW